MKSMTNKNTLHEICIYCGSKNLKWYDIYGDSQCKDCGKHQETKNDGERYIRASQGW